MIYNIHYDICALIIFMILLFCFYLKKNIPNTQNKTFSALIWAGLITTVADICSAFLITYHADSTWLLFFSCYMYYIFLNVIPIIYAFYIITLTDTQDKLMGKKVSLLFIVPAFLTFAIIASNPLTKQVFNLDSQHQYDHGFAIYLLYVIAAYYLIYGIIYATIYKDIITRNTRVSLYSFAIICSIPIIIQIFLPQVLLGMFGISICVLLVFLTIQRPEEILNAMTGLFNRMAFINMASVDFRNHKSFTVISVHFNELAYFRRTFGIPFMNSILKEIADYLAQYLANRAQLYYIGEGQFSILVPAKEMTSEFPYHIHNIFERTWGTDSMKLNFSTQIFVIRCPHDADSIEALMDYMDNLSDNQEQNNAVIFASDLSRLEKSRITDVESAVQNALANDLFEVYYQGIYSVEQHKFHSAEALIRLTDEKLGAISPAEFIPITEKNGAIIQVGMTVFRKVCQFIAANSLKDYGIEYIEVNPSVAQCMQKTLARQLLEELRYYNIPTDYINFEITETAAALSPETLAENMKTLAEAGIRFSLDDYGTGYANMSSMVELPFHIVKIDREIIASMNNEKTYIAMNSTIAMLKQLNMKIVAEGIETAEQVSTLSQMGCDYLQGYYFSRPVNQNEFLELLKQQQPEKKESEIPF